MIYTKPNKSADLNAFLKRSDGCAENNSISVNPKKTVIIPIIPKYWSSISLFTVYKKPCSTAFAPLSKSYSVAKASEHKARKMLAISAIKKTKSFVSKYFIEVTIKWLGSHLNLKNNYFQMILLSVFAVTATANTEFKFTPCSKIESQISSDELNRIEINGGDIMEVVGDEAKYSLYWSSDWRNLFIKPKVSVGETFELSLIFFGGLTQDIRFTAGDTTAKTIRINLDNSGVPKATLQFEVTAMMRTMFESMKGKYYVTDTNRVLKKTDRLEITQIKAYRYKDLSGAVVEVKNNTKTPVNVSEEDFRGLFKSTLAINLKSLNIAPRGKTLLFIVTKGGINDK